MQSDTVSCASAVHLHAQGGFLLGKTCEALPSTKPDPQALHEPGAEANVVCRLPGVLLNTCPAQAEPVCKDEEAL